MIAILLLAASLAPAAAAQAGNATRTALLAVDPGGDQSVVAPQVPNPATPAPTYPNVDILSILAVQPVSAPSSVTLYVNFSAPPTLRQQVTFQFAVSRGPDSAPASTATGTVRTVSVAGTTVTGAEGATAGGSSNQLFLTLPYAGIGASPGDVLGQLVVTASDRDGGPTGGGPLPDSVPSDDTSASDRAPDTGAAGAFTLQPPPFRSDLAATIVGGEVRDANGTRSFTGASVTTLDGNATVRLDVRVESRARAPDTVRLATSDAPSPLRIDLPGPALLPPGGQATLAVTVHLGGALPGPVSLRVVATGQAGQAEATATLLVQPAPPGHRPIPAALGFLTPVVTSLGLVGPLGNYAELAFLLFVVLLAFVVLFLALFLVQTPWLRVAVEPRRALAAPGGVAEFRIRLDRARRGVSAAKAVLRSAPWSAAFRFRGPPSPTGTVQVDPANPAEGILRVEVPPGTPSLERETVEFDIIPMDAQGAEMPRHRAHGHVTVQALQPPANDPRVPKSRDIRLASVRHEPPDPLPGGTVITTATVHNDGGSSASLRIVLLLDNVPVVEELVEVAPRSTRDIALPWAAGAGKNQVKVQVFLA